MRVFGRDPVIILGLVSAAVQLFSALFLPLDQAQQAGLNAVAAAVLGLAAAAAVSVDRAVPLVMGVVQSVLALAVAFGFALSPETNSALGAFTAAGIAMWTRTQVGAKVPAAAEV